MDPPEGKQQENNGRRRYDQMATEPEIIAEPGAPP
jgi:hypothetical protein